MSRRSRRARLLALLLLTPASAFAQASTNTRALDQLAPPATAHKTQAAPHAHARTAHHGHADARKTAPAPATRAARHAATPAPRIAAPSIPARPPAPPVIAPPPLHVDTHPPPPPPPVPIDPKAPGSADTTPGGARLGFGAGSAALNPAMDAVLLATANRLKAAPDSVVTLDSYAAGTRQDMSAARRLSLARALAARAVLINAGIPSTRIYARALGVPEPTDGAPADRVDVTVAPAAGAGVNPPSGGQVSGAAGR